MPVRSPKPKRRIASCSLSPPSACAICIAPTLLDSRITSTGFMIFVSRCPAPGIAQPPPAARLRELYRPDVARLPDPVHGLHDLRLVVPGVVDYPVRHRYAVRH